MHNKDFCFFYSELQNLYTLKPPYLKNTTLIERSKKKYGYKNKGSNSVQTAHE